MPELVSSSVAHALEYKVIVPVKFRDDRQGDTVWTLVKSVFSRCHCAVLVAGGERVAAAVQPKYEEPLFEVVGRLCASGGDGVVGPRRLSERVAVEWCRETSGALHGAPRLHFVTPQAYDLSCTPRHPPTDGQYHTFERVNMGNLLNFGTLLNHADLSDETRGLFADCDDLFAAYEFLHDQRKLFITMKRRFGPRTNRKPQAEAVAPQELLTVEIEYDAVDLIVVDAHVEGGRRRLHLRLSRAPKMEVHRKSREHYKEQKVHGGFESSSRNGRAQPRSRFVDIQQRLDAMRRRLVDFPVVALTFPKPSPPRQQSQPVSTSFYGVLPAKLERENRRSNYDVQDYFFDIVGRLRSRTKQPIYFCSVEMTEPSPFVRLLRRVYEPMLPKLLTKLELDADALSGANFGAGYTVEALLSRGAFVTDQLLATEASARELMERVLGRLGQDEHSREAVESALEQLLDAVDDRRHMNLLRAFDYFYNIFKDERAEGELLLGRGFGKDELPRNCVTIHKVLVTPTRLLPMAPELQMGNRVLRKFGVDYALRISLRGDDFGILRDYQLKDCTSRLNVLLGQTGIEIGGRKYKFLAWSNSQMRDHGCFMYADNVQDGVVVNAGLIREWMGISCIRDPGLPKVMARLGQLFTQAQETIELPRDQYEVIRDVTGGRKPDSNERYCFSDGVGLLGADAAVEMVPYLDPPPAGVPSAFQVRLDGKKGMLAVDPRLGIEWPGKRAIFVDSMNKYERETSDRLEVVKFSMQTGVTLNGPLVMILDQLNAQMAESQGVAVHSRVRDCVHELLEKQIFRMGDMLMSEMRSVDALEECTLCNYQMVQSKGFQLTREPFFRGLLLAIHRFTIKEELYKAKIEVPKKKGRTMYGILDETGRLQKDQVFIQYSSVDFNREKPFIVHTGAAMVTKNPCLVGGDVRLLEAVDIEQLHHHRDVIVFPRWGDRPLPDMMAGSDLDGDEYCVFFDKELMFAENEEPMHFDLETDKTTDQDARNQRTVSNMVCAFLKFVSAESIGPLSAAHIVAADQEPDGLHSDVCRRIAQKCSQAVDFAKTGVPASKLEPDERAEFYPDFKQKDHKPMYMSERLLGELFRRAKRVGDIIDLGQESLEVRVDEEIRRLDDDGGESDGWLGFGDDAQRTLDRYTAHLQALMSTYGVPDEMSLVSGKMSCLRNRINDRERDDFSLFNTDRIIGMRFQAIVNKFRQEFLDEFGDNILMNEENPDKPYIMEPSVQMQDKAIAWYRAAYSPTNRSGFLSMPWIMWDVLMVVKYAQVARNDSYDAHPVETDLAATIDAFCAAADEKSYNDVLARLFRRCDAIRECCERVAGLDKLFYVLHKWATGKDQQLFEHSRLNEVHLALLFLRYIKNGFRRCELHVEDPFHGTIFLADDGRLAKEKEPWQRGALLLRFLRFCASRRFLSMPSLRLDEADAARVPSTLRRGEWRLLSQVAFSTFHQCALTAKFSALFSDDAAAGGAHSWQNAELELPLIVEMRLQAEGELDITTETVLDKLKEWSKCDEVRLRPYTLGAGRHRKLFIVSGRGTLVHRQRLEHLLLYPNLIGKMRAGEVPFEAFFEF